MKALIGVDRRKANNTVAVSDERGKLLECTEFSADRSGLQALEQWTKRSPERRWAIEGVNSLGRTQAHRSVYLGEPVV